ncbi:hypothetical protein M0802_003092 [Mischocyttarus mexicanus]|nr:hypothetical protein M0802_003092 [Mischocyttarus mexicanus]
MKMGEIVEISQGEVGRNPVKNTWGDIMDKIQYWCPEEGALRAAEERRISTGDDYDDYDERRRRTTETIDLFPGPFYSGPDIILF